MDKNKLEQIAQVMVAPGKGILAIDESHSTCKKRFEALDVDFTEENRRLYRQLLVTAPGIEDYLSGYILFDETIRQSTDEGLLFREVLRDKGIMPGIKVDLGTTGFPENQAEKITKGLDDLGERLKQYADFATPFTKWRAVITISDGLPTKANIKANVSTLAKYAAIVQAAGMVPIVEPEILIDGNHSIDRCDEVSRMTWQYLFEAMKEEQVYLPGAILKTSMVTSGVEAQERAGVEEVAQRTVAALKTTVPSDLAGVVFLSGGQTEVESTRHLNAMNKLSEDKPWPLTFSYGRAIQQPALEIWSANPQDIKQAQDALVFRAKMNSLASQGKYSKEMESDRPYS